MAPLPKRRRSKSRQRMRMSNYKIHHIAGAGSCSKCEGPKLPHRACPSCGYYNGRYVVEQEQTVEEESQG